MITLNLTKEDLIQALKKFKSIAKQDILSSSLTSNPAFWKEHAEARRRQYLELIEKIENGSVEETYAYALDIYEKISKNNENNDNPEIRGKEQAIEIFFQIIGIKPDKLKASCENHQSFQDILMENEKNQLFENYQTV